MLNDGAAVIEPVFTVRHLLLHSSGYFHAVTQHRGPRDLHSAGLLRGAQPPRCRRHYSGNPAFSRPSCNMASRPGSAKGVARANCAIVAPGESESSLPTASRAASTRPNSAFAVANTQYEVSQLG